MTTKQKKKPPTVAKTFPRKQLNCISGATEDEQGRSYAKMITSPDLAAFRVIGMMQPKHLADGIDHPTMIATLQDQAAAVNRGDMAHPEAMLINQASSLQALFVRLTERSMEQQHMPNIEGFMRLALRAQSQCRATLETLAAIKNPPIVYAKQANVTTGPQQINNGIATQAGNYQNEPIKQAGGSYELLQDTRASQADERISPALEAVGEKHRAEVTRGESQGIDECG